MRGRMYIAQISWHFGNFRYFSTKIDEDHRKKEMKVFSVTTRVQGFKAWGLKARGSWHWAIALYGKSTHDTTQDGLLFGDNIGIFTDAPNKIGAEESTYSHLQKPVDDGDDVYNSLDNR